MRKFTIPLYLLIFGLWGCGGSESVSHKSSVTIVESEPLASEGLDLQAIGAHLEKVKAINAELLWLTYELKSAGYIP